MLLNSQEPLTEENRIVPIQLNLKGQTGTFTFNILTQTLPTGTIAFIRDMYLGEITEISQGSNFTFTVFDATSSSDDRFELIISPYLVTSGKSFVGKGSLIVSPNPSDPDKGSQISINGFSGNEVQILVTDITGRKVLSHKSDLHNGSLVYPLNCSKLPAGLYTIQVSTTEKKLTRKLILK